MKAFKKECGGVLITEDNLASKLDFALCVRTQLQNHKKYPKSTWGKLVVSKSSENIDQLSIPSYESIYLFNLSGKNEF